MNTHYDVAIIGCGEAGIFAGYELKKLRPELSVLVLDQGGVVEWGTHEELLEKNGIYAGLYAVQWSDFTET